MKEKRPTREGLSIAASHSRKTQSRKARIGVLYCVDEVGRSAIFKEDRDREDAAGHSMQVLAIVIKTAK